MSSFVYDSFSDESVRAQIANGSLTVKTMLVTGMYVPSRGGHTRRSDITGEIVGTGYTAGGQTTAVTVAKDTTNHRETLTFANLTWAAATLSAQGAVRYISRGGAANADNLIEYLDFGSRRTVTALDFVVTGSTVLTFQNEPNVPGDPTPPSLSLPQLARQGPKWGVGDVIMRSVARGGTYLDPVSGATVLRITDAGFIAQGAHEYSSMNHIDSLPWTSGGRTYITLLYGNPNSGATRLVDIDVTDPRAPTISNDRGAPSDTLFTRTHACFSTNPATPRILYYLSSPRESTIVRYDTATNSAAPSGHFPKDCSGVTTGLYHEQLQVSNDERFFAFQHSSSTRLYCVKYDNTLDQLATKTTDEAAAVCPASPLAGFWNGLDEIHLRRDGNGLFMGGSDSGSGANYRHPIVYWNFATGVLTDGTPNMPGVVHTDGNDGQWITHCTGIGGLQGFYTFNIEQAVKNRVLTFINSTDGNVHCSSHYVTPGAASDADRYFGAECEEDGIIQGCVGVPTSNWRFLTWTVDTGTIGVDAVYKTQPTYRWNQTNARMASGGLAWQTNTGDTSRWRASLTRVATRGEVVAGTFFHDQTTNTTYLRPLDDLDISGATYKTHIGLVCPNALNEGIGIFRLDGSAGWLLCHHYSKDSLTSSYYVIPRHNFLQSGKGVAFDSNMGIQGGRGDLFVALFPDGHPPTA